MVKNSRIIIIDADVISHFITGGEILNLTRIFTIPIKILDKVYAELKQFKKRKTEVENLVNLKLVEVIPFPEEDEEIKKEYFNIKKLQFKGDGESACMAVAKFQKHILASSNLKDIQHYCRMHEIDYLTTMDFLCEALRKEIFTEERCNQFISAVLAAKSKLPVKKMKDYSCRKLDFI